MRKMKISFILLAVVLLFTQCYKDNSNKEISVINPLVIDNTLQSTSISVFQMDTLHVAPMIYKNGVEDANLTYEWKLSMYDGSITPVVLGTSMVLHAEMTASPQPVAYTLTLTVTDVTTSIQSFAEYSVSVSSSLGRGLVVADTHDGGSTSDISLIMSENFSWNLDALNNRIFKNIYSGVNKTKIEGTVKGLISSYHQHRTLSVYTDNSILRMDPYDYVQQERDNEMFYIDVPLADFKPLSIEFYDGALLEYANMNGTIYPRKVRWGNNNYAFQFFTSDKSPYKISQGTQYSQSYENVLYYDELSNRFLINEGYDGLLIFEKANSHFDPNNIGAYDALYMGRGQLGSNAAVHSILKSETDNKYFCYSIRTGSPYNIADLVVEPIGRYELTNCENISQANYFECNPREDVIFYADDNSIYSAVLGISGQAVTSTKRYTANPGEVITGMKLWRASSTQGRMRFKDTNSETGYVRESALYRMMVISTYNSSTGEGKIITIPIARIGGGELETDRSFHVQYGGFGKITAFEQQKN